MKMLSLRITTIASFSLLLVGVCQYADTQGLRGVDDFLDVYRDLKRACIDIPSFDEKDEPSTVLSFFAFGATPFRGDDRKCLNGQLRHMNLKYDDYNKLIFHLGDLLPSDKCMLFDYQQIANMFTHYRNSRAFDPKDVFFVPGEKEWNRCENPDEAWQNWSKVLGPGGSHQFGTGSEVDVSRGKYGNFAFVMDKTLFIGTNVVGGGAVGDEDVRLGYNMRWIKKAMKANKGAMVATVIFGHSALNSSNQKRQAMGNPIKSLLKEEYENLPVLYIHASGSEDPGFCVTDPSEKTKYYHAVQLAKGKDAPPVKISLLEKDGEYRFAIDQRGGAYGEKGCPPEGKNTWATNFEDTPERPQLFTPKLFTYGRQNRVTPMGLCQGSCISIDDCEGDLICFKRQGDTPVPGCVDDGGGKPDKNYCYKRGSLGADGELPSLVTFKKAKHNLPLQICEGDCSIRGEHHCDEGLICHKPTGYDGWTVPGCSGKANPNVEYCIPKPPPQRCQACVVLVDAGINEEFVETIGAKFVELEACEKKSCVKQASAALTNLRVQAAKGGDITTRQNRIVKQFVKSEIAQKFQEVTQSKKKDMNSTS